MNATGIPTVGAIVCQHRGMSTRARIPDAVAGPIFAQGVEMTSSGDAVFMTFFVSIDGPDGSTEQVAVQRIVLSESSLEHFALELGKIVGKRLADRSD